MSNTLDQDPSKLNEREAKILKQFEEGVVFPQMPQEAKDLWPQLNPYSRYLLANVLMVDLNEIEGMNHPKPSQQDLDKMKQERIAKLPKEVKDSLKDQERTEREWANFRAGRGMWAKQGSSGSAAQKSR
jgi:hypothetical protein